MTNVDDFLITQEAAMIRVAKYLSKNETNELSNDDLDKMVSLRWSAFKGFARRTVMEAWYCGEALNVMRERLDHGDWGPWLHDKGIPRSTAARFMRIQRHVTVGEAAKFSTVKAAYASLPKGPDKEVLVNEDGTTELVHYKQPEIEEVLERELLAEQAREAEEKSRRLERELRKISNLEAATQPPEMRSAIEELTGQAEEWEQKYERLYAEHVDIKDRYLRLKGAIAKLNWQLEEKQKELDRLRVRLKEAGIDDDADAEAALALPS